MGVQFMSTLLSSIFPSLLSFSTLLPVPHSNLHPSMQLSHSFFSLSLPPSFLPSHPCFALLLFSPQTCLHTHHSYLSPPHSSLLIFSFPHHSSLPPPLPPQLLTSLLHIAPSPHSPILTPFLPTASNSLTHHHSLFYHHSLPPSPTTTDSFAPQHSLPTAAGDSGGPDLPQTAPGNP